MKIKLCRELSNIIKTELFSNNEIDTEKLSNHIKECNGCKNDLKTLFETLGKKYPILKMLINTNLLFNK